MSENKYSVVDCIKVDGDLKLIVKDKSSLKLEECSVSEVKDRVESGVGIDGVVLVPGINPSLTLGGMKINLDYINSFRIGDWCVAVIKKGSLYSHNLSMTAETDLVHFYNLNSGFNRSTHPCGSFVAGFHLETLLNHNGKLYLDYDNPELRVSADEFGKIKEFLQAFK